MKNKILYTLLVVIFGLYFVSCNNKDKNNNSDDASATENVDQKSNDTENAVTTTDEANLFVSEEGNFKINFPGEPTYSVSPVQTDIGQINMHTYTLEQGSNAAYMLAYADYPKEMVEAADKTELLQNTRDGFIGSLGLTVENEETRKINGHEGLYFKAAGNGMFAIMTDYLINNRLYQIGILRADRYPTDNEVEEFIESFQLINK